MRIEKFSPSPDRVGRYWLTFQGGEKLTLYRQTVEDFGLYTGKELSDAEYARLLEAAGEMSAKMRAVRIVSASSVSKGSLRQRLIQKGETPAQAQAAVAWMSELNLLDDRHTATQVVQSCISRGYGLQRAKQALYEKRIPKEYWEEALADYPVQDDRIRQFLLSRLDADSDQKAIKKAVDALLRRGHRYGDIRRVLNELRFDTQDFIED